MNWVVTLIINADQTIEERLRGLVDYIFKRDKIENILIYDIDATGKKGNLLTKKMNSLKGGYLALDKNELSILMSESGQIFELDLYLKSSYQFRIVVRDGSVIDLLGTGEMIPMEAIGNYEQIDINLYRTKK